MFPTKIPFALSLCLISWLLVTGSAGADVMVNDTFGVPTVDDNDKKHDPTPAPDAPHGTFSFKATFCNHNGPDMVHGDLESHTQILTNNNILLNRNQTTSTGTGVGSRLNFPYAGDYSNLSLLQQPMECVDVTYKIGLAMAGSFKFNVDTWLMRDVLLSASGPATVQEGNDVRLHALMGPLDPGETPAFAWVQEFVGTEPSVNLIDETTSNPGFTAPPLLSIPKFPEMLRFKVTATLNGKSQEKFVDVEVDAGNVRVETGQDKSATTGHLVSLHATSVPGPADRWEWFQTLGETVTLTDDDTANPFFTAPLTSQALEFEVLATVGSDVGRGLAVVNIIRQTNLQVQSGGDIIATSGHLVNLWCTASGDVPTTDSWTQISGTPTVPLTDVGTLHASFKAPIVTAATDFGFECRADNATARMRVTVKPPAPALIVDAGRGQDVLEGVKVNLHGNGSGGVPPLAYAWTWSIAPTGFTMADSDTQTPSFVTPAVNADTPLTLRLTVTDSDTPPVAKTNDVTYTVKNRNFTVTTGTTHTGPDHDVFSSERVHLHAHSQGGLPTVTYQWTQTAGVTVSLDKTSSDNPNFSAPVVTADQTLTFNVVATDAVLTTPNTAHASVDVLVKPESERPLKLKLTGSEFAKKDEHVILQGSATGGVKPYSYAWTSTPTVSFSPSATVANPTYTQPDGDVTLTLTVTDAVGATQHKDKKVTKSHFIIAEVCNGPPVICEQRYREAKCWSPNHYAINYLRNTADGQRFLTRRCGNKDTCQNDWWVTSSDDDKCTTFNPDGYMSYAFECTWCCTTDRCNLPIRPEDRSLFVGISSRTGPSVPLAGPEDSSTPQNGGPEQIRHTQMPEPR